MALSRRSALGIVVLAVGGLCSASTITTTGTFTFDSDLQVVTFNVTVPEEIIVTSFGYGGGLDGLGDLILPGGFAPDLGLFDPSGNLIAQDTTGGTAIGTGCSNNTNQDPTTHLCLDATIAFSTDVLGTYTVVLSEQNIGNDPPSLYTGPGSYSLPPGTDVTTPPFQDILGDQRNGNFAFDISTVSTPEPGTVLGVFLGICAIAGWKRRTSSQGRS